VSTTFALYRRELAVFFVSPMAYIILTCMMLLFGVFVWTGTKGAAMMNIPFSYSEVLYLIAYLMVVIAPLVTMRLVAEEKSRGTIETLMTAPVTELQVILAKYGATLTFMLFLLLPTAAHAILVSKYGTFDVTEALAGYLGVFLTSASLLAIGLFVSSICSSQVTAGVISFVVICLLLASAMIAQFISQYSELGKAARSVIEVLDPYGSMNDFKRGIIDTRPVVYLLSLIVFFLFLSVRALESRRWR